jgi:quercetin dioxygenase-like cupin family protein
MSELPAPDDRHQLRISDADREKVTEVLREAAGEGRITLDELDTRLEATYQAKTYADLVPITRDLPVGNTASPELIRRDAYPAERFGGTPKRRRSIAILSGARRGGPWVVPSAYTASAFLGGVDMDLREARFTDREVHIRAYAILGGINIVVPDDIEVDVEGIGFMGAFDHSGSGSGVSGAPRLRVTGFAFMGGVNVERKRREKRPEIGGGGRAS